MTRPGAAAILLGFAAALPVAGQVTLVRATIPVDFSVVRRPS
jgi:hypothetical protein